MSDHHQERFSILVCGGQDYYGDTAERDRQVVVHAAKLLHERKPGVQVLTGGTAGIPDDFARIFAEQGGTTIDIVSAEYLEKYKARTSKRPRPYLVLGETQEKRRLAFLGISSSDMRAALAIQGGPYTAHELELLSVQKPETRLVPFTGSGGATGGDLAYDKDGFVFHPKDDLSQKPYASRDATADPIEIATALVNDLLA